MSDIAPLAMPGDACPPDGQSNPKLDRLIDRLRSMLAPVQTRERDAFAAPIQPVILVVGCPRSGSTLATQLLAASGSFAYPTNVLSRFAYAPMIGAMVQQLLFDPEFSFCAELADIQATPPFASSMGRTAGALAINQFFHFWRRFVQTDVPSHLSDTDLARVDIDALRRELASIESVFGKPFMAKGKMLQFHAGFFAAQMPELLFVRIKRNPRYVMQSLVLARRTIHGSDQVWWSHRPKEFSWLRHLDAAHQVAGQVLFTERALDRELAAVDADHRVTYDYQSLCSDSGGLYELVRAACTVHGCPLTAHTSAVECPSGDYDKLDQSEIRALEAAYADLDRLQPDGLDSAP